MGTRSAVQTSRVSQESGRVKDDSIDRSVVKGALGALVQNIRELEIELATEKGPFDFFGLILREESAKWDLVVAAKWFGADDRDALELIAKKLRQAVGETGMGMISRIVMLAPHDDFVVEITKTTRCEHGLKEIESAEFSGVQISRGFIITSQKSRSVKFRAK